MLRSFTLFLLIAGIGTFVTPIVAQQKTPPPAEFVSWLPISDAERAQKIPVVEKSAGAEILQWRVRVVDEFLSTGELQRVFYHYIRVKVFNEAGKAAMATVDLPYVEPGNITSVSGRTIRADGGIAELDGSSVFRRDVVRIGGRKEKVVSFAMPAVEPGAILEYRWKETQNDNRFRYLRLKFARDIPVQQVTYFVKPLSSEYVATERMSMMPFQCQPTPLQLTNDGWNFTTVVNVAASSDEPYAPSKPNLEPWALLFYHEGDMKQPEKYWNEEGKRVFNKMKSALKATDEMKAAATEIASSAKTEDERITGLVLWVRKRLRGLFDAGVTDAERSEFIKKLPNGRDRTTAEILKSGMAMADEMNVVFAALAAQAGFDARPALVADHNEVMFDPRRYADRYFLDNVAMALKSGNTWKVFDVSRKYLTPGMLPPYEDGVFALITDSKAPAFVAVPSATPEASAEIRSGALQLSSKGTLSGNVEETYSGHRANEYRVELSPMSAAQREEWFRERIVNLFPGANVTSLKVENADNAVQPLKVTYQLEAPQFAQVTGKRILFQPNAFRRATRIRFTASERRFPVKFPYAWKEKDSLRIGLPEGFTLESPENPGSLEFGEPGSYNLRMATRTGELEVERELTFGNKGQLIFSVATYPALKKIFDTVNLHDAVLLSLREN